MPNIRIPQTVAKRVVLKAYLSDGVTEATGKTIAIVISKNGAAFGNPAAGATNAAEIGSGWYYADLGTGDTDTLGPLIVRGTATGVDPTEAVFEVANAHHGGFDALPNAAAEAAGGLYTRGAGAGQINQPGNGLIDVSLKAILNTALTETAGQIAAGVKKFFDIASPTSTMNLITAVTTVTTTTTATNLTNAPTNGDFTATMKTSLNAATPTSVTGAVGSVTGAVGSVTAGVTVTTNNDKAGYSLSTAPLTSTQTAQAVLDAVATSYNAAGSIGGKINTAASAGDPLSSDVPGAYTGNQAGKVLADIKSKTDTLTSTSITVTSPVVDASTVQIVRGDDYKNADGRALFATTTFSNAPSLAGGAVALHVRNNTTPFTKAGVIVSASTCYVELTTAETAAFTPGSYLFNLQATLSNGDIVTIAQGQFKVTADVR